jgi:hypothetical protein
LWTLGLRGVGQNLVTAIAFLGLAWFLSVAANRPGGLLIKGLVAALVWYGAAFGVLNSRIDLMFSRGELLIAAGLGTVLAVLPYVLSGWAGTLGMAALAAAVGVVLLLGRQTSVARSANQWIMYSALKPFLFPPLTSSNRFRYRREALLRPTEDQYCSSRVTVHFMSSTGTPRAACIRGSSPSRCQQIN